MAQDVFRRTLKPAVGGLHVLLCGKDDGIQHALLGEYNVRPLIHVVPLVFKRLADVFQHFRNLDQKHVAVEQVVDIIQRIVVPEIIVDFVVVVRLAHQTVSVHGKDGEL